MPLHRTTSTDPRFRTLTRELDAELARIYGDVQAGYDGFNQFACDTVVVDEGVACGCFKAFAHDVAELKGMYVRPEARKRGSATAIVAELETWAHELGFRTMILETGNLQTAAIAMYTRAGYHVIDPFGPYVDMPASICMRKAL